MPGRSFFWGWIGSLLVACVQLAAMGSGTTQLEAQQISVFDFDATDYPRIRAKLSAFDATGKQILGIHPGDVHVTENSVVRAVTELKCPPVSTPVPISSILAIDSEVSLTIAKAAAKAWVQALPPAPTECAITTFRKQSLIHSDFSTDRTALLNSIEEMGTIFGRLDYNAAFLTPPAGALPMFERAVYKKVMILVTNCFGWNLIPAQAAIVNEAKRQDLTLYVLVVGQPAPDFILDLCARIGGTCLDQIHTESDAAAAIQRISYMAQMSAPCGIEWQSDGCDRERSIGVSVDGVDSAFQDRFELPSDIVPQLSFSPSNSLRFGETTPGVDAELHITMTAKGRSIHVAGILASNARFRVADFGGDTPPFDLAAGESRTLTVSYAGSDYSYAYCHFDVTNDGCMASSFHADAGWRGILDGAADSIKVVRANGGEVFGSGDEQMLRWEGVMPEDRILLEYSTDAGASWIIITDSAYGLSHLWRVEKRPSDECLLRATCMEPARFEMEMALIPAGTFRMGNITEHHIGANGEKPVHTVTLSHAFLMSTTEVTEAQYRSVMGQTPCLSRGEDCAVVCITWFDAIAFCNRLSRLEGFDTCYSGLGDDIVCDFSANGYRLPTEAEWEYACRAGTETDFYTGNMSSEECLPVDPALDAAGWYCGNAFDVRPVGLKRPNAFGLYDMHGNAWEWCWDWWNKTYYSVSPSTDPRGPEEPDKSFYPSRVVRGGSWARYAWDASSSSRYKINPEPVMGIYGFRVVRSQ